MVFLFDFFFFFFEGGFIQRSLVGGHVIMVDMFSPPKFMLWFRLCLVVCYVWKKAHGKGENRHMETNVVNEVTE